MPSSSTGQASKGYSTPSTRQACRSPTALLMRRRCGATNCDCLAGVEPRFATGPRNPRRSAVVIWSNLPVHRFGPIGASCLDVAGLEPDDLAVDPQAQPTRRSERFPDGRRESRPPTVRRKARIWSLDSERAGSAMPDEASPTRSGRTQQDEGSCCRSRTLMGHEIVTFDELVQSGRTRRQATFGGCGPMRR
jgi:hypothetical protein